jgi:hypothetical protein
MKLEDIMSMWDKDSKLDETELGAESAAIPEKHNKYLKIYTAEKYVFNKLRAEYKRTKRKLLEYYLGELDRQELDEIGRDQIYKKILKNEVDTYIESDEMMIDVTLKLALQEEKINFLDAVIRQINNRGFQIKNSIDWMKFTMG